MNDKKTEALERAAGLALEVFKKHRQMKGEYPMGMLGVRAVEAIEAAFCQMDEALAEQPESKPWLGLTDDDIESAMPGGIYDCLGDPWDCGVGDGDYMRSIKKDVLFVARAAIAAYEEKNGITGEKA